MMIQFNTFNFTFYFFNLPFSIHIHFLCEDTLRYYIILIPYTRKNQLVILQDIQETKNKTQ